MFRRETVHITALHASSDRRRVSAEVNGAPVWFECDDLPLTAVPEALAGAFLIPALHTRAHLKVDAPLDAAWHAATARLVEIFAEWWGYPREHPCGPAPPSIGASPLRRQSPGSVAQCFTGGVDSFYSLLHGENRPQCLMFVHGYDISLADIHRARHTDAMLRTVAAERGLRAAVLRTNLREHPLFNAVSWERTHGAALAACGLLSKEHIERLVVPATSITPPWGSTPDSDPLWSLPGVVEIAHADAAVHRRQKTLTLAHEPLVQRHLRVCWENQAPAGNCSACEKCLRTMALLEAAGQLERYHRVFDVATPLSQRIDRLRPVAGHLLFVWSDIAGRNVRPETRAAIHRLLRRSRVRALRKKLRRWLRKWRSQGAFNVLLARMKRSSQRMRQRSSTS